jgi:hypothetical protein
MITDDIDEIMQMKVHTCAPGRGPPAALMAADCH